MRKLENFHLLVMLILLVAVGQMAQTIYVPVIADIAHDLSVRTGAVQRVMAAYLLTYGFSQLIYGPISDRIGRRPVILTGMMIFLLGALGALLSTNLTMLVAASAIQGMGTGVAGVMARTMPRDLYAGTALRYANSLLNMGILVSPLLAPVIGGALAMVFGWRAVTPSCWRCAPALPSPCSAGCRRPVRYRRKNAACWPVSANCWVTVPSAAIW